MRSQALTVQSAKKMRVYTKTPRSYRGLGPLIQTNFGMLIIAFIGSGEQVKAFAVVCHCALVAVPGIRDELLGSVRLKKLCWAKRAAQLLATAGFYEEHRKLEAVACAYKKNYRQDNKDHQPTPREGAFSSYQ